MNFLRTDYLIMDAWFSLWALMVTSVPSLFPAKTVYCRKINNTRHHQSHVVINVHGWLSDLLHAEAEVWEKYHFIKLPKIVRSLAIDAEQTPTNLLPPPPTPKLTNHVLGEMLPKAVAKMSRSLDSCIDQQKRVRKRGGSEGGTEKTFWPISLLARFVTGSLLFRIALFGWFSRDFALFCFSFLSLLLHVLIWPRVNLSWRPWARSSKG